MRYDTPIFFQRIQRGAYNASTGNYGEDSITEEKRYADVTDTGTEHLTLIYGKIQQGSLTIRLQRSYKVPFNRIRIGEKLYNVDFARHLKTFVVSEVP